MIVKHIRTILTAVFITIGIQSAFAYDANNLVNSALANDVDRESFMSYFQDGNLLSLAIGIICAIVIFLLRKRISKNWLFIFIPIIATLIILPTGLMAIGAGYFLAFLLSAFIGMCVIAFLLFIILPISLIYGAIKLIKTKNLEQSLSSVWSHIINGFGTVPVGICFGLLAYGAADLITYTWNIDQCEKYVQAHWNEDFDKVTPLMSQWEASHKLQWGFSAEEYYQRNEIRFMKYPEKY